MREIRRFFGTVEFICQTIQVEFWCADKKLKRWLCKVIAFTIVYGLPKELF